MSKQKMARMTGYGKGYVPPTGNAGVAAKGVYSNASNPMSVPRKGSSINSASVLGRNGDHAKVMAMKAQQAMNESLRGEAC